MKQHLLNLTSFLALALVHQLTNAQPTITSFTPMSGVIGTTVTITGANFNSTINNNIVFFGATQAILLTANATTLTVIVPTGATYQYITITDVISNLTGYSKQPFIVSFPNCGSLDSLSFAPKVDSLTGNVPRSISICDIDMDGKVDIATANYDQNSISIFRNLSTNGNVSFSPKIDITSGTSPFGITIGDVDGDGKPDIVVANFNAITVSVFLNLSSSGTITFSPKTDFSVGVSPRSVTIGDLDGDGKPEIITASSYISNSVFSVLKNTGTVGNLSFAPKIMFTTGTYANAMSCSIGDLDGDGKPDVAVANQYVNTISIFRNSSTIGNISFFPQVDFSTGTSPYSASIGDLDGDGKPELTSANFNASTISILKNKSVLGNISFDPKIDFTSGVCPGGTQSNSTFITDLDGDSKPDLLVTNGTLNTVAFFSNKSTSGAISLASRIEYHTGEYPISIAAGDIDGDGMPDICTANYFDTTISILRHLQCATGISNYESPHLNITISNNPFANFTTLQSSENLRNATLIVYNSLGQAVKRINNLSGQTIVFHRDNLPSGLYFIRLIQDSKISGSEKLVIRDY